MDAPEPSSSIRKRRSLGVRLLRWSVPRALFLLSHVLFRSCRIRFVDKEHEDQFLRVGHPIIFAGLHEGLLYLPFHFRDRDGVVMVSASRDGDLIADTMARFGLRAARGSSTRGGRAALDAMIEEIRGHAGCSAGIIVDGPRGPARVAKLGAVLLARETGLPIVPGAWWSTPALHNRSWDETILPLPFARLVVAFEEAMLVPPDASAATMEACRVELSARLGRARARAQAAARGERPPIDARAALV
ncbi:MAG: lysophospholipid acyltransferase family protein [bacterium]|nr:lysophospholipid acyltransferase family protein [bacterium]